MMKTLLVSTTILFTSAGLSLAMSPNAIDLTQLGVSAKSGAHQAPIQLADKGKAESGDDSSSSGPSSSGDDNGDDNDDDNDNDNNDDNDNSSSGRDKPRVPGGRGCDDPGDIAEHPECRT